MDGSPPPHRRSQSPAWLSGALAAPNSLYLIAAAVAQSNGETRVVSPSFEEERRRKAILRPGDTLLMDLALSLVCSSNTPSSTTASTLPPADMMFPHAAVAGAKPGGTSLADLRAQGTEQSYSGPSSVRPAGLRMASLPGVMMMSPAQLESMQQAYTPPKSELSKASCWGAHLKGSVATCTPDFTHGKGHFKNKLCPNCRREGVILPSERVKAVPLQLREKYKNSSGALAAHNIAPRARGSSTRDARTDDAHVPRTATHARAGLGFWATMDGTTCSIRGSVRLVNQTLSCNGPWLVVLQLAQDDETLEAFGLAAVPDEWVRGGQVKLKAAKGTLEPAFGAVDASIMGVHRGAAVPSPAHGVLMEPLRTQPIAKAAVATAPLAAPVPEMAMAPVPVSAASPHAPPTDNDGVAAAAPLVVTAAAVVATTGVGASIMSGARPGSCNDLARRDSPELAPDLSSKSASGLSSMTDTPVRTGGARSPASQSATPPPAVGAEEEEKEEEEHEATWKRRKSTCAAPGLSSWPPNGSSTSTSSLSGLHLAATAAPTDETMPIMTTGIPSAHHPMYVPAHYPERAAASTAAALEPYGMGMPTHAALLGPGMAKPQPSSNPTLIPALVGALPGSKAHLEHVQHAVHLAALERAAEQDLRISMDAYARLGGVISLDAYARLGGGCLPSGQPCGDGMVDLAGHAARRAAHAGGVDAMFS